MRMMNCTLKGAWLRNIAVPASALALTLAACSNMPAAELGVVGYETDDITYTWGNVNINVLVGGFEISAFEAETPRDQPPIKSVTVEVWDDANGNNTLDPGEAGEAFTYEGSTHHVTMANLKGELGSSPTNPRYKVTIRTTAGGGVTHGGPVTTH